MKGRCVCECILVSRFFPGFFTREKPFFKNFYTCGRWKDEMWGNFTKKWNGGTITYFFTELCLCIRRKLEVFYVWIIRLNDQTPFWHMQLHQQQQQQQCLQIQMQLQIQLQQQQQQHNHCNYKISWLKNCEENNSVNLTFRVFVLILKLKQVYKHQTETSNKRGKLSWQDMSSYVFASKVNE